MPSIPKSVTQEIGSSQPLGSTYGWPWDLSEDTPELTWPLSVIVYDRMRRSDAQVIGTLAALTLPLRQAQWSVDARDASPQVTQELADDLALPVLGQKRATPRLRSRNRFKFYDHLREALLALAYGHMPFEQVYEIVDKKARLRKLAARMPRTLTKIDVDDQGELSAIVQGYFERPGPPELSIPADRLVYYCNDREGGAWQGLSILRASYKNWTLKERLLRVANITVERNGMGVPSVDAPQGTTKPQLQELARMAQAYRAGDSSGLAMPYGAKLRLMGVEGTLPDALPLIRYHDEQITRPMLEMFMQLGSTHTGSRALGGAFIDFFAIALQAHAEGYAETFTTDMVEDWVDLNYGPNEPAPALVCQTIDAERDIDPAALVSLLDAGAIEMDDDLETFLRDRYKLPGRNDEQPARTLLDKPSGFGVAARRRGRRPFVYE